MAGTEETVVTATLAELLPHRFALRGGGRESASPGAAAVVRARAPGWKGGVALLLGSGLGGIAAALEEAVTIPYAELPGFPEPTVPGHAGELVLGRLAGVPLLCLRGRVHIYEGRGAAVVLPMIRSLRELGCTLLIVTNAAGSLRCDLGPGALVLVRDHLNLQGTNPLLGLRDEAGPPFLDLSDLYDAGAGERMLEAAAEAGIPLATGVYLATLGPCFETPAEIRAFRALGADLVGMSLVPEAIAARACGLRLVALSVVTNLAAGLAPAPLSHEETLAAGRAAGEGLLALLRAALPRLAG
ncbi:MAG TPA: purine-nucleoside phosphorylase [Rhodospirillales bacterium]|nr:purine-nucleoside phosphorylase [Rhodospirillales bacterium]